MDECGRPSWTCYLGKIIKVGKKTGIGGPSARRAAFFVDGFVNRSWGPSPSRPIVTRRLRCAIAVSSFRSRNNFRHNGRWRWRWLETVFFIDGSVCVCVFFLLFYSPNGLVFFLGTESCFVMCVWWVWIARGCVCSSVSIVEQYVARASVVSDAGKQLPSRPTQASAIKAKSLIV